MFVYMLNCHGEPLMPCQPRKAGLLLKVGAAKVVRSVPFTLQLLFGSSGYKQEIALGIDAGTQHIGVSATTEQAVLFEAEGAPRTDIQRLLATRRQFRRARRNRKTRYRAERFLTLDLQKITHPEIEGEGYQQGPQLGFWNVHHIESSKTGGNRPENLIAVCETCHDLIHRTHQEQKLERSSKGFRDATQMSIMRWRIYERVKAMFPHVHLTYGYITKHLRIENNLEKSHVMDARCISGHPLACSQGTWYLIKMVRRNNRRLHKATIRKGGQRQRHTAPKYVHGHRLFDCVKYQGTTCFVFGRRNSGYFDLRTLDGTQFHHSASSKKLTLVQRASACLVERRAAFAPTPKRDGFSRHVMR